MTTVNNAIYSTLGERWYTADDDPIALLRAEARARNPWVSQRLRARFGTADVLDLGCGGGFLSNALAKQGHRVTGIDLAPEALATAQRHDGTKSVAYEVGDVRALRFADGRFDAVCAMDVLEHVEDWKKLVNESARMLRPGGTFFFYTFNRTFLAWLFAVKGVGWVVRNTPAHLHVHSLFIKPRELAQHCESKGMKVVEMTGFGPRVFSKPFARLLWTGRVPMDFEFRTQRSLALGYLGMAVRA